MLRKCYAFTSQPNKSFKVKAMEIVYDSYGNKSKDDIRLTNHMIRKRIRNLNKSYIPLDISLKTDYKLGHDLSLEFLKYKKTSIKNILRDSLIYKGQKKYSDFVKTQIIDGKEKKIKLKPVDPLYFKIDNFKIPYKEAQLACDYVVFKALHDNEKLVTTLIDNHYNVFIDKKYIPQKSLYSIANSIALFKSLYEEGYIEHYLNDIDLLAYARVHQHN